MDSPRTLGVFVKPLVWARHGYVEAPRGRTPDVWGTYKRTSDSTGRTQTYAFFPEGGFQGNKYRTEEEALAALAAYRLTGGKDV